MLFSLNPNSVIAFRESNKILLAVILEIKGKKYFILSEENEKILINDDKIVLSLSQKIQLDGKEHTIAKELKSIRTNCISLEDQIDLSEIYEVIQSEETGYTIKSLSEICFIGEITDLKMLKLLITLSDDSTYFKLKDNLYFPKPIKQVQQKLQQIESKKLNDEKKELAKKSAIEWLNTFINDRDSLPETIIVPSEVLSYIEPLKRLAIFQSEYERKSYAEDIVNELKATCNLKIIGNAIETSYRLLVSLNLFKEDENIFILRYNIPTEFAQEAIDESFNLEEYKPENREAFRNSFVDLYTITIDDETTRDIDDALTLEYLNNGMRLGIHIADVSYFIKNGSPLDKEAIDRGTTVYLPVGKINMFPESLSENKMSLVENTHRPTLSFMVNFDNELNIIDKNIVLGEIKVDKKLTYEMSDKIMHDDPESEIGKMLLTLQKIATKINQDRIDNGALDFKNIEIKVRVSEDGNITVKKVTEHYKSDDIVRETMIFGNKMAAEYCWLHELPAVFFSQEPPDEPIRFTEEIIRKRRLFFENIKKLKKTDVVLQPGKHASLGVSAYTQATSPIRRYHDLIIHRQIKHFIEHKAPLYTKEEVLKILEVAERTSKETKTIEKETIRYWLLKYLKMNKGQVLNASVIRKLPNSYILELSDTLLQCNYISPKVIESDEILKVVVDRINPLLNVLTVKRVYE